MLIKLNDVINYKLRTRDGKMGKVKDVYFDDRSWAIRYMVADTGNWLKGKKVLLIPSVLGRPDKKEENIPVDLTQEQIEKCPGIDARKPVSRQQEMDFHRFFKWDPYWVPGGQNWYGHPTPPEVQRQKKETDRPEVPYGHLRSLEEVKKYFVHAEDGDIGKVKDFIVEIPGWTHRYAVVDTGNWLPGRKVLISSQWILNIRWDQKKVYTDLSREEIQSSPEFDPSQPVERTYEKKLHHHYRRSGYWKKNNFN